MNNRILKQAATNHRDAILQPYDLIMEMNGGFEAICAFSDYFSGTTMYVPSKKAIFQQCLELEAIREFNGYNLRDLCRKYGFSESHLRKTIRGR